MGTPIPPEVFQHHERLEALSLQWYLAQVAKEAEGEEDQLGEDAGDDEGETDEGKPFKTSTKPEGTSPSIEQVKRDQQGVAPTPTVTRKASAPLIRPAGGLPPSGMCPDETVQN
jgi:hypothetical protein